MSDTRAANAIDQLGETVSAGTRQGTQNLAIETQADLDESTIEKSSSTAKWVISLTCLVVLAVHLTLGFLYGQLKKLDEISIAIIFIGLLPWLAGILSSAKVGGVEFSFLKERVDKQGNDLTTLKFLISHFLSGPEREWLHRLANKKVFIIDTNKYPEEFKSEIRHLRSLGFVDNFEDKGIRAMHSGPPGTRNVHDYFFITESGRTYLELRKKLIGDGDWKFKRG